MEVKAQIKESTKLATQDQSKYLRFRISLKLPLAMTCRTPVLFQAMQLATEQSIQIATKN